MTIIELDKNGIPGTGKYAMLSILSRMLSLGSLMIHESDTSWGQKSWGVFFFTKTYPEIQSALASCQLVAMI
jgi:hypothetical protein